MSHKTQKHRKELTGAKAVDSSCRNHGTCPWCKGNRTYFDTKHRGIADEKLRELI